MAANINERMMQLCWWSDATDMGASCHRAGGFISIDCGYTARPEYTDRKTNLTYVSDAGFTDAGLSHTVDLGRVLRADLAQRYSTVRFFPNGTRNCYTMRSLESGGKYFVRAVFAYGDYDTLNKPPTFDLYFGVNYWTTVTIVNASMPYGFDMIGISPANYLQICLVNTESGTPFISGLDLRPLAANLYPEVNLTQSLVLLSFFRPTVAFGFNRYHFGTDDHHIRYPVDPYDRVWQKYEDVPSWTDVLNKTNGTVKNPLTDQYGPPSALMRSASTPLNASRMDISWSTDSSMSPAADTSYIVLLYFTELEVVQGTRQFHVFVNNNPLEAAFSPTFLETTVLRGTVQGPGPHIVSLVETSSSTHQPVISAMEIYMLRPFNQSSIDSQDKKKNKTILVLQIAVPLIAAMVLLFVALLVLWQKSKKKPDLARSTRPFENRRFKYKELKRITNNFNREIGRGGFGPVYVGYLEDGTPVAVKMQSKASLQGKEEFLAEAHHLARVHHRNLVSLVGYCKDKKHLCLVYEYMDGGNLQNRLTGQEPLNWLQRLNVALDSAYGLEYLHKSCSPPLIHRDIKTGNILLTANLNAKLSDFGLSKAFSSETRTHTTTRVAGTPGYLDPEYHETSHLRESSDVYSFGTVLLVLISAQPAIITVGTERKAIGRWVRVRLLESDIESVIDPRIRGDCDLNSVWMVVELALHCTEHKGQDRPKIAEVVERLKDSLQLETSSRSLRSNSNSSGAGGSVSADAESVGVLDAELSGEASAR
ncbi:LRR receptor-like serine/threonine-protein kinase IOS1 [Hordeum vulgare subsp. vulgare]|nr:LRR receptor-like serine/threonine-protein kinase IOS1 [Hordeum vulgare subsp. vulgare]